MIHVETSSKDIHLLILDLIAAVEERDYGLIHIHDLQKTMKNKGVVFPQHCQVIEICHPHHAARILGEDIRVNLALPCRIGVWEEDGQTKVGTLLPTKLLVAFGDSPVMMETAVQVESDILAIIKDAI